MLKEVKKKEAGVLEKIIKTPKNPATPPQNTLEIEARIAANPEIMKRIAQGDAKAVTEYFFIMGASEASISEPVRPE